jgi:16S rRNA (cytosine1402-N4)-methyltransferase
MAEYEGCHQSVLLRSSVESLVLHPDGVYVDGTYGRGGHSKAILNQLSAKAKLLVFDQDIEAIEAAKRAQLEDERILVFHCNFRRMKEEIERYGVLGEVNGLLLDIGVSSPQLDTPERGFSIQHLGPLDMRMNNQQGVTALQWLKESRVEEIRQALKSFADVRYAGKWARLIQERVLDGTVKSTYDLAGLVEQNMPKKIQLQMNVHPATKIFQAIRIAVNKEIEALEECLRSAGEILCQGGRLVVISFHSVEHRLLRKFARGDSQNLPRNLPAMMSNDWEIVQLLGYPEDSEVQSNRRARSARLTVLQKLG